MKGKSELIYEVMVTEDLDILVIIESWLKNDQKDKIWLDSQEFAKGLFTAENIPR